MSEENSGTEKAISKSHINQILVLRSMNQKEPGTAEPRALQIEEIAEQSGLNDERETQRYLFILEGQKFVSPQPDGDFTSKTWVITPHGMKALKTIKKAVVL